MMALWRAVSHDRTASRCYTLVQGLGILLKVAVCHVRQLDNNQFVFLWRE